jgi:hypothetical protein
MSDERTFKVIGAAMAAFGTSCKKVNNPVKAIGKEYAPVKRLRDVTGAS